MEVEKQLENSSWGLGSIPGGCCLDKSLTLSEPPFLLPEMLDVKVSSIFITFLNFLAPLFSCLLLVPLSVT
jgi:hypothetical protein